MADLVERLWKKFCESEQLSDNQCHQFKRYHTMLLEANKQTNLTSITDLPSILKRHFSDSLALRSALSLNNSIKNFVDVGSGAGFPSIPLKILYPDISMLIIEVKKKKIAFLEEIITMLNLKNIEISDLDWRTFLRKTQKSVDFFISRASLSPEELCRALKPACLYNTATIVYWATCDWEANKKVAPFMQKEFPYKIGKKERKLIFFGT